MNGLALKNLAHSIAIVTHDGQCRKGLGEPYINHVERVADSVYGWEKKCIAYLHDVVEDCDIAFEDIAKFFPENIVSGVKLLTRDESLSYSQFIDRMIASGRKDVIEIKIADIQDNLRDIDDINLPSLKIRYTASLAKLETALLES